MIVHLAYVACDRCGAPASQPEDDAHRERTLADAYDYNPIQMITGQPLGWYSGDDGEICQQCMTKQLRPGASDA